MTKYRRLTDEVLADIAKKYKTRREFFDGDPSAYVTANRRNLLDTICAHMYRKRFRWTKQMLVNAAKPFQTRTEFATKHKAAYSAACRQKLLDEVCAHMSAPHQRRKEQA